MSGPIDGKVRELYESAASLNKDGGTAFPARLEEYDTRGVLHRQVWPGLTARDYFAGQAIAGLCGAFREPAEAAPVAANLAEDAYLIADAMLAERLKEPKP